MSRKGNNIYKRKDGRWEGRYKRGIAGDGKAVYGSCYGKTYREVKDKLEICKLQVLQNEKRSARSVFKPFAFYCDEWLDVNKNTVKESTVVKYKTALENHIKPFFGEYTPQIITTELTADFVDYLISSKKLSAKTAKDTAVILKSILKYVSKNNSGIEMVDVVMPKYKAKEIRVLTQEEQRKFFDFLISDMDIYKFVTVRETMQRIKNLSGEGAKTKIVFSSPKSGTSARIVPLTNTAYELCKEKVSNVSPNAFLLTGCESKYVEPRVLQFQIKKYTEQCGIEDLHFHVLRHTFATRCVEVGFEIKSLSEVLGHSSPKITLERYVHSSVEFKKKNMAKLEAVGL